MIELILFSGIIGVGVGGPLVVDRMSYTDKKQKRIKKYLKTHNPKHLKKVSFWIGEDIYQTLKSADKFKDIPEEYNQYLNAVDFYLTSGSWGTERALSILRKKKKDLLSAYSQLTVTTDDKSMVNLTEEALNSIRKERMEMDKK